MKVLKEFDLDCPSNPDIRRNFRLHTRCVTALFERCFPRFETPSCWKLLVECVPVVTRPEMRDLLGVYTIQVEARPATFYELSSTGERKRWALGALRLGVDSLLSQTGWNRLPFDEAFAKVQESGLVNSWVWRKPVRSPSRKMVASVICEHDVEKCDIIIDVTDSAGHGIKREVVVSDAPDEFAYSRHLGSLRWDGDSTVVLESKQGGSRWSVQLA